jgi:creatinine amidohydrolase
MFILNGHGGNNELIQLAARDTALKHDVRVAATSYWVLARAELEAVHYDPHASLPGHAGMFETSQMMALTPDLVQEPRPVRKDDTEFLYSVHPPFRIEEHGFWESFDGFTDSPSRATAEAGKRYLEAVVGAVAKAYREFYRRP